MEKLKMQSPNLSKENREKIKELFPDAVTEIKDEKGNVKLGIDFDVLKQELSDEVIEGREERYQMTWPDKRKAVILSNAVISDTLRPLREKSLDFDHTENVYIEGDNLAALKVLRETYLRKIRVIYIDPPYNTGSDFVYKDDFSQDNTEYLGASAQIDSEGNRLVVNNETNGRFHTDWLNMIYPRLRIAKDFLTDDGVIFISIGDDELANLKKVCDEIFGEDNFVNVISVNAKNIAGASGGGEDKRLKKNMEYLLVYARDYYSLKQFKNSYVYTKISDLVQQYRDEGISWKYTTALTNPGEKIYVGSTVDGDGSEIKIFRRDNFEMKSISQIMSDESISEADAYKKYKDCIFQTAMPQSSIRPRVMKKVQEIGIASDLYSIEYTPKTGRNKGVVYEQFYKGENFRLFAWLKDVSEEKDGQLYKKDLQGTFWDFVGETKNLTKEGGVPFPNGKKPVKLVRQIINMVADQDDYVLDFFSGSATTAQAVMQLNSEDGGHRKFILVQLPELCDEDSDTFKAGFKNICDAGEERIRRAGAQIKEGSPLTTQNLDTGFRVFKVDTTNLKDVFLTPEKTQASQLSLFESNVKEDRTSLDLLFQVMLQLGIILSSKIETRSFFGKTCYFVQGDSLAACFEKDVDDKTITEIANLHPLYACFGDSSFANDSASVNCEQIFKTLSPNTKLKII
jgi:adenine-specific DNA-methyltransferase